MILIIDDNKELADIMCRLLNALGYDAIGVYSGEDGIAKARELRPKAILCDIGMEGMNGHEVAKHIRRDKNLKDIYLVAISGYSTEKDIKLSMNAGFDKHLFKPVSLEMLKDTLNKIYR